MAIHCIPFIPSVVNFVQITADKESKYPFGCSVWFNVLASDEEMHGSSYTAVCDRYSASCILLWCYTWTALYRTQRLFIVEFLKLRWRVVKKSGCWSGTFLFLFRVSPVDFSTGIWTLRLSCPNKVMAKPIPYKSLDKCYRIVHHILIDSGLFF